MENNATVKKVTGGMLWTFAERFFAQGVTAIVTVVLARILSPEDYGIISIVMVLISIGDVFATNGIGNALVQKQKIRSIDYDSAFYLNVFISVVIYIIIFLIAPYISAFYSIKILTPVIRVMGVRIPIAAANSVQQAYVRRAMRFRFFFFATLGGTIISGILGILAAYLGAGVWALVIQYLANVLIDTCVLFGLNGWKPSLRFSWRSAQITLSFGWKLLLAELIATIANRLKVLVAGYSFGTTELAYYEQGNRYPSLLTTSVNTAINQVMLPVFSQSQENLYQIKNMLRRTIQVGFFFLSPILIGFAVISDGFVKIFLTEKWAECVPYMRIFCVYYLTRPLEAVSDQAFQSIGRTDLRLYKIIVVDILTFICLMVTVLHLRSIFYLACTSLFTMMVSMLINIYYANKTFHYRISEQIYDLIAPIAAAVIMGVFVKLIGLIQLPIIAVFCIQIVMGAIFYLFFSWIFNCDCLIYVFKYFKGIIK